MAIRDSRRADGQTHREFALPRGRACQHQVCQVRAGDEQHEPRNTRAAATTTSNTAARHCETPRPPGHRRQAELLPVRVVRVAGRRELIEERRAQGSDVLGGLIKRPSRLEATHADEPPVVPLIERVAPQSAAAQIGSAMSKRLAHLEAGESRRRDTDDLKAALADHDRRADGGVASAELALPELVADDHPAGAQPRRSSAG